MTAVLVLGAAGFIGRRVVAALAREGDLRPVALVRRPSAGLPEGVEVRRADASDRDRLAQALSGIDAVVNCVAGGERVLVDVTRNLCAAAEAAGVRRLVHISSMAVYGPAVGRIEEAHPLEPSLGPYGHAKVACEHLVAGAAAAGHETVILRPGCVHGPGSVQWTERLGRLLTRHRIGDLGPDGDGTCNLTFVDDLAAAVICAVRSGEARGEAFNVSDPDPETWNDYLIALGRAIGAVPVARVSSRWLRFETRIVAPAVTLADRAASRARFPLRAPACIPPSLARTWRQDIVLDHRKADARLGFPRTPPDAALAAASAWFRAGAR